MPLDSAFERHFARNSTRLSRVDLSSAANAKKLKGYVRYGIIPGAYPAGTLRNLQRLYGRLAGVNVAVKARFRTTEERPTQTHTTVTHLFVRRRCLPLA